MKVDGIQQEGGEENQRNGEREEHGKKNGMDEMEWRKRRKGKQSGER